MKIAVLGCGNMAQALIIPMKGEAEIFTYTPSKIKADYLALQVGGTSVLEISELPKCDAYLISCKPQQFDELVASLRKIDLKGAVVISVMAGISTKSIREKLNHGAVIRMMPNTPATVGSGVIALYSTDEVSTELLISIVRLFQHGSRVYTFNKEDQIDVITPFSGSGPAYIFELGRILLEKMLAMGIDLKVAREMISGTFLGASQMMSLSDKSFEELRNDVTSKKGVTYEALSILKNCELERIFEEAIDAAYARSIELSR